MHRTRNTGVEFLICSNFSQIPVPGGKKLIGQFNLIADNEVDFDLVVASDVGAPYDDGFLSDCNLASLLPDDGIVGIDIFSGHPCIPDISPPSAVVESPGSFQFSVTGITMCCQYTPVYFWSDNCTDGEVDQEGLFTADPIFVTEACEVCVIDVANTNWGYYGETCADLVIMPFVPCQADIAPIPDGNCKVDLSDLMLMKQEFNRTDCSPGNPCHADIAPAPDGNNKVDLSDLVVMKGEFLRPDCCP